MKLPATAVTAALLLLWLTTLSPASYSSLLSHEMWRCIQ